MSGGRSHSSSFSDCRSLLCIQRGRHSKVAIIFLAIMFRRFIRRKFLALHRIVGLDLNLPGGLVGSFFHQRYWSFGRPADFVSPVTTIAAHTTKRFGLIRRHAPLVSRAKATGANVRSRSSCKMFIVTFFILRSSSFWF